MFHWKWDLFLITSNNGISSHCKAVVFFVWTWAPFMSNKTRTHSSVGFFCLALTVWNHSAKQPSKNEKSEQHAAVYFSLLQIDAIVKCLWPHNKSTHQIANLFPICARMKHASSLILSPLYFSLVFFLFFFCLVRASSIIQHSKVTMGGPQCKCKERQEEREKRRKSFMWLFDSRIKIGKVFIVILCDFPDKLTTLQLNLVYAILYVSEWGLHVGYFKPQYRHKKELALPFSLCCYV